MKLFCPKCGHPIKSADANIEKDTAVCVACDEFFTVKSLIQREDTDLNPTFDIYSPPQGVWFERGFRHDFSLGSTTRSIAGALFLVPFTLVWSGGSLGTIYLGQLVEGRFDFAASLIGIPFLLFSIPLIAITIMTICGRQKIEVRDGQGTIFTGVGSIGYRKRFDWTTVTKVVEIVSTGENSSNHNSQILLEGEKPIKFGTGLSKQRREYFLAALQHLHREQAASERSGKF